MRSVSTLSPHQLNSADYTKMWSNIKENITDTLTHKQSSVTEMELYHLIYTISIAPGEMWRILQANILSYLSKHCSNVAESLSSREVMSQKLEIYVAEFANYQNALKHTEKFCKYLTTYYLHESISECGKRIWLDTVFTQHSKEIMGEAMELIHKIRDAKTPNDTRGKSYDQITLDSFREVLLSSGYNAQVSRENYEMFENAYITDFENLTKTLENIDGQKFVESALKLEETEEKNVWVNLDKSTIEKGKAVTNTLWVKKIGCVGKLLLEGLNENETLVELIYNGMKKSVDQTIIEDLRKEYAGWIVSVAFTAIKNFVGDRTLWVERLVEILHKVNHSLDLLHNDLSFIQTAEITLKNILVAAPHKNTENNPMYIAQYIHDSLRVSSSQVHKLSNPPKTKFTPLEVIDLSCYLQDHDIFDDWYLKLLAKRLLSHEVQDLKTEESIINRLREISGVSYATKLGRMFSDITMSSKLTQEFSAQTKSEILDVSICTGGTWPLKPSENIDLPEVMKNLSGTFEHFYKKRFESRKLQWVLNVSTVCLTWEHGGQKRKVVLPSIAAAIVLFVSTGQKFKNEGEVFTTYQSMIKSGVLTQDGKISEQFVNGHYHRVSVAERKGDDKIKEDRTAWGEAVCVRLMKRLKRCNEREFINLVIKEKAAFIPTEAFVQSVIEKLIEKEYIEREKGKSGIIKYVYA
ncbi:cullin, putative [Entamoeba invadens IP1]|uniref:Cullin, putative n=1 Tax=Entamoeba invadens IP1 TaxID=370355 RepID=A0A0A1UE22_ENTIV|nr:cullin, putative [Entamoeba invadens IP1]ELP94856.1 cullin, putative [Entamoeba invadens IP1]|eukprot:XP_004261627.1 cullin, putative [Entamoeba invadens IP1]